MKLIIIILFVISKPIEILSQYDSSYYTNSNYGKKYYYDGDYKKSIFHYSLIHDSLLRPIDFIVLLNMYSNLNDTNNIKNTTLKYIKGKNSCEKILGIKSLFKYKNLLQNICISDFDSIYNLEYKKLLPLIYFLDSSIRHSNSLRKEEKLDSSKIAKLDNDAFLFLKTINIEKSAKGLKYIIQKDYKVYLNLQATLVHINYYDSISSELIENWAKQLMYYGILEPKEYAYIIDRRLATKGSKKQKYGEHLWTYNKLELQEININRKKIGLIPLY